MFPPQGIGAGVRGVTKLSELEIDTDKDWGGYRIKNLGPPIDARDAIRKVELDYHRNAVPIDHPYNSISTSNFEYRPENTSFLYLYAIGKINMVRAPVQDEIQYYGLILPEVFVDKAIQEYSASVLFYKFVGRWIDAGNHYNVYNGCYAFRPCSCGIEVEYQGDFQILAETQFTGYYGDIYFYKFSIKGSSLNLYVEDTETPKLSATDTTFAAGYFGSCGTDYPLSIGLNAYIVEPSSTAPPAQVVLETEIIGDGKNERFIPLMSTDIVEIPSTRQLSREDKRYNIFRTKRCRDSEIISSLDSNERKVDLDVVSWGAFEFYPNKASTAIITITGDNPYKSGAIQRQVEFAKKKNLRVFSAPKDYNEAINLYNQLKRDYPHWLAGKDNFAYQVLGWEILDFMQNIDFYYGELLEHKTHYSELKKISEIEISNRLNKLIDKLNREVALVNEKDRHISKAKEILKKGW
jgi:hypothetical protein